MAKSPVVAIMIFADTLSSLADKQMPGANGVHDKSFLDIFERRLFLRFLPNRRHHSRLYLRIVNDEWRVMLSDPKTPNGPFFGADFSTSEGEDAASALRGVWIRESNGWRLCTSKPKWMRSVAVSNVLLNLPGCSILIRRHDSQFIAI